MRSRWGEGRRERRETSLSLLPPAHALRKTNLLTPMDAPFKGTRQSGNNGKVIITGEGFEGGMGQAKLSTRPEGKKKKEMEHPRTAQIHTSTHALVQRSQV